MTKLKYFALPLLLSSNFIAVVLNTEKDRTDLVLNRQERKKGSTNPEFAAKYKYMVTAKLIHEGIPKEQEKYKNMYQYHLKFYPC